MSLKFCSWAIAQKMKVRRQQLTCRSCGRIRGGHHGNPWINLGTIRKGDKKQTRTDKAGKEYQIQGKDLEYFRFDGRFEWLNRKFSERYGDEPNELKIWLPYPTTDQNFPCFMEEWKAGGLLRRCDRQTIVLHQENGKMSTQEKPCIQECGCKPVGRLSLILPEFLRDGIVGFVTLETHSVHDVMTLTENLLAAESMRNNLSGIPFILRRAPREISTPQDGKRVRRTKSLLTLEPDATWVRQQIASLEIEAGLQPTLPAAPTMPLLTAASVVNAPPQGKPLKYVVQDLREPNEFDRGAVMGAIDVEIQRLGWTVEMGRSHLKRCYSKSSRQLLTDSELWGFLKHLEILPSPVEVLSEGEQIERYLRSVQGN
jgi:Recombination directionality factor-like